MKGSCEKLAQAAKSYQSAFTVFLNLKMLEDVSSGDSTGP